MDDLQIIQLYNARVETAINETHNKYGRMLHGIAFNILSNHWDSEEIVNDTYSKAWNTIPPNEPKFLGAYLGRITRNLSINRWHKQRAKKRYKGAELLLSELQDCIPHSDTIETEMQTKELVEVINCWLDTLPPDDRILFLRRYWFGDSVNQLAKKCITSPNKLAGRLYRLRQSLKKALEMEGISL
ncbi:MAG: sigma-70 family RNA polymerase sigma factor [Clostridiales bacterium]|jgi:RNA polymerase sigma factor (sigma-70 family)|nr:sigma-70 family RNA polymerase sigma factor [Clostridiales bacterium]